MALTQQQLDERLNYITGSDASVICGVNPFKSKLKLWYEKTRLIEQEEVNNRFIKAGNYLEPVILQWFSDETGLNVTPGNDSLIVHPEHKFMAGNIDGFIRSENMVFEAKTSAYGHGFGPQGSFEIPDHYLCQIVHYVACKDANGAYLSVLIGGNDLRWYRYERNEKLERAIIEKEREFWDLIKTETPPDPETADDIALLYGNISESSAVAATTEIQEVVEELRTVREIADNTSEKQKYLENKIKIFMGINDTLIGNSGKIATWKSTKDSVTFDTKRFEIEHPALYEKYLKVREGHRRFLIK